jgi:hypothetical protein
VIGLASVLDPSGGSIADIAAVLVVARGVEMSRRVAGVAPSRVQGRLSGDTDPCVARTCGIIEDDAKPAV